MPAAPRATGDVSNSSSTAETSDTGQPRDRVNNSSSSDDDTMSGCDGGELSDGGADGVIANDVSLSEAAASPDATMTLEKPDGAAAAADLNNNHEPMYDGSIINIVPSGDLNFPDPALSSNVINIVPFDEQV